MKCASQGGHLVIIDAAHENSFVRQYLAEYRSKRLDFFLRQTDALWLSKLNFYVDAILPVVLTNT